MKRIAFALLLMAAPAFGQAIIHGFGDPRVITPTPNCAFSRFYVDDSTGIMYQANQSSPCVWAPSNSTGGGTWGSIGGTLSSQTDLQNALQAKAAAPQNPTVQFGSYMATGTPTFVLMDASTPATVTLPAIPTAGFGIAVYNMGTAPVTINPNGLVLIGAATLLPGQQCWIQTDGANYYTGPPGPANPSPVGRTYYISPSGSDSTGNGTLGSPWASPAHPFNCGDTLQAATGTYSASNFGTGKWGPVNCPAGNNVTWLKCATFDACYISSGSGGGGILVTASYWGVQGFEVSNSGTGGPCFGATPPTTSAGIHHFVFTNNVANGCAAGGFSFYNNGQASVDYIAVVGNIAYNTAQSSSHCYSGFSAYQPVASDTNSGTHIYFAWDYGFGIVDHNPCAGTTPTDGNCGIFDSFDGANPGAGTGVIYTQQAVMENLLCVDNGGRAWEYQTYTKGTSVAHPTVYIQNVTGWGNQTDPNANYSICADGSLNLGYGLTISKNIDMTTASTACTSHTLIGINIYDSSANNATVAGNLVYTASGSNINTFNDDSNTAPSVTSNTTGTNPLFAAAANPSAPSCSGTASVTACMASLISNFTPSAAAAGLGYQAPTSTPATDPLYPCWLNNVNLPPGLVTAGCL